MCSMPRAFMTCQTFIDNETNREYKYNNNNWIDINAITTNIEWICSHAWWKYCYCYLSSVSTWYQNYLNSEMMLTDYLNSGTKLEQIKALQMTNNDWVIHWRGTKSDTSTLILASPKNLLILGNDSFASEFKDKKLEMTNSEAMNLSTLHSPRTVHWMFSVQHQSVYNIILN